MKIAKGIYFMELSIKFKRLRRELDISQAELANLLSLSPGSIYKYESGKVIPRADVISRLEGLVRNKEGREKKITSINSENYHTVYSLSSRNMVQLINLQSDRIRYLEKIIKQLKFKEK